MNLQTRDLASVPEIVLKQFSKMFDKSKKPNWRTIISALPKDFYNARAIESFAIAILKPSSSPTMAFLKDLITRNRKVSDLLGWLLILRQNGHKVEQAISLLGQDAPGSISSQMNATDNIIITIQPASGIAIPGQRYEFKCGVYGNEPLKYQWFHGKEPVGLESNIMFLPSFNKCDAGYYICRISNSRHYCFTEWASVEIYQMPAENLKCIPSISIHPRSVSCFVGEKVNLFCDAVGSPAPRFQWHHDDVRIEKATSRDYIIPSADIAEAGLFSCTAFNECGTVSSLSACVIVTDRSKQPLEDSDLFRGGGCSLTPIDQGSTRSDGPVSKVALLIGNETYEQKDSLGMLVHPGNDTRDIAGALMSIGFTVVSLLDLNLKDFKNAVAVFCDLLDENVYAVFYFAGHGFEVQGESYLMPVDATGSFSITENYPASQILSLMVKKNSKLNMIILDCCRTTPESYLNNPIPRLCDTLPVSQSNVIVCFGCCSQRRVLESPLQSNGFLAKHLCKHIGDNVKVDDVVFEVAKRLYDENIVDPANGMAQVVYRYSTLVAELSLCDPISPGLPCDGSQQLKLDSWKLLHEAPKSPVTVFQNNCVRVDLIFTAEFSNVLLIQSRTFSLASCVVRFLMPSSIGGSRVQMLKPGKGEKSQQFTDGEVVRICNLERLQGEVTIHLEVTYDSGDERKRQMAFYSLVDKPLFAKITEFTVFDNING